MMSLATKQLTGVVIAAKGRGATKRVVSCKAAAAAAGGTSNSKYVRKHILDLAPYTPIVPFEVLSGDRLTDWIDLT